MNYKKKRWTVMFITISALLFSLSGCDKLKEKYEEIIKKQAPGQTEAVETVFAVNTTTAVQGQIYNYIELNGDVVTKGNVDIYADTAGKITSLSIEVGDKIGKDQVIAEVDPSRPGMKFVASPVKSPISGTVISIPVQIGSTVTQAAPIAKVSRTDELQITTDVAERFISRMRTGLSAIIRFEAFPDRRFSARITELSPTVDPQSRTMELKLALNRPDPRIKTGMFARIKIITDKKNDIVKIPAQCMIKRYGEYFVFVVHREQGDPEKAVVEKRKVNPGIEIDNKLEITEGLRPGEEIVIRGQTLLEDKSRVKVIDMIQPLEPEDIIE